MWGVLSALPGTGKSKAGGQAGLGCALRWGEGLLKLQLLQLSPCQGREGGGRNWDPEAVRTDW